VREFGTDEPMIKAEHLEKYVVKPTLERMAEFDKRLNTDVSVTLMLGTAAQETLMGFYLHQFGGGPGKGIYSIEPETHLDIVGRYLQRPENAKLLQIVEGFVSRGAKLGDHDELIYNLRYATAIARIKYWTRPEKLPTDATDIAALGKYWDVHYNANDKVGFPAEFVGNYEKYVRKQR